MKKRILLIYFCLMPISFFGKDRRPSLPYITGDAFREISDYILEYKQDYLNIINNLNINKFKTKNAEIFFIKPEFLILFCLTILPEIKSKIILITHNTDLSSPGNYLELISNNSNIVHWFGVNSDLKLKNIKFTPIPLGLSNRYNNIYNTPEVIKQVQGYAFKNNNKKHFLGLNFVANTNLSERSQAYNYFCNKSFTKTFVNNNNHGIKIYPEYLKDMAETKFIVCPHGNGLDTHRVWEALLVGSIPIVKASSLDVLYQDLPVIIVKKWQDITKDFLDNKYEIISKNLKNKKYKLEKLYFNYWHDKIKKIQKLYKK